MSISKQKRLKQPTQSYNKSYSPDFLNNYDDNSRSSLQKSKIIKKKAYEESTTMISILQQKLKIMIKANSLPLCYYDQFQKALFGRFKNFTHSRQQYIAELKEAYSKQIESFQNGNSFGKKIYYLIQQRAHHIKEVKLMMIRQKISSQKKQSLNLSYISENLIQLRDISLRAIEHLALWKSSLNSKQEDEYSKFVIQSLTKDVEFLRQSPLRKFLQFSSSSDPLLLHSVKKFEKLELKTNYNSRAILNFLEINDQYKKRLIHANKFIKHKDPSIITSDYPFDEYDSDQQEKIPQEFQSSREESILQKSPTSKKKQSINLPVIHEKNKPKNRQNLQESKIYQRLENKITELLKPIIQVAKERRLNRVQPRLSTQIEDSDNENFAKVERKSLSINRQGVYDDRKHSSIKARNTPKSSKEIAQIAHRKYRLVTQSHDGSNQNARQQNKKSFIMNQSHLDHPQFQQDYDDDNDNVNNGKHRPSILSEKRKKLKPMDKQSMTHQLSSFLKQNQHEDEEIQQELLLRNLNNKPQIINKPEGQSNQNNDDVSSSKKTIKVPKNLINSLNKIDDISAEKQKTKNLQIQSPTKEQKVNKQQKKTSTPAQVSKMYETQTQQIDYENGSLIGEKRKLYQLKQIMKKQQQLQKALKKFQAIQEQQQKKNKINWNSNNNNNSKQSKSNKKIYPQQSSKKDEQTSFDRECVKIKRQLQSRNSQNKNHPLAQPVRKVNQFMKSPQQQQKNKKSTNSERKDEKRVIDSERSRGKSGVNSSNNNNNRYQFPNNNNDKRQNNNSILPVSLQKQKNSQKNNSNSQNDVKNNDDSLMVDNNNNNFSFSPLSALPKQNRQIGKIKTFNMTPKNIQDEIEKQSIQLLINKDNNNNQKYFKSQLSPQSNKITNRVSQQSYNQLNNNNNKQPQQQQNSNNRASLSQLNKSKSKQQLLLLDQYLNNNNCNDQKKQNKINVTSIKQSNHNQFNNNNDNKLNNNNNQSYSSHRQQPIIEQRSYSALRLTSNVSNASHKSKNNNQNNQQNYNINSNLKQQKPKVQTITNTQQVSPQKDIQSNISNNNTININNKNNSNNNSSNDIQLNKPIISVNINTSKMNSNQQPNNKNKTPLINSQTNSNENNQNTTPTSYNSNNNITTNTNNTMNTIMNNTTNNNDNKESITIVPKKNTFSRQQLSNDLMLQTIQQKQSYAQQSQGNRSPQYRTLSTPQNINKQIQLDNFHLDNHHSNYRTNINKDINKQSNNNRVSDNRNNDNNKKEENQQQQQQGINNNNRFTIKPLPASNQQQQQKITNINNKVLIKPQEKDKANSNNNNGMIPSKVQIKVQQSNNNNFNNNKANNNTNNNQQKQQSIELSKINTSNNSPTISQPTNLNNNDNTSSITTKNDINTQNNINTNNTNNSLNNNTNNSQNKPLISVNVNSNQQQQQQSISLQEKQKLQYQPKNQPNQNINTSNNNNNNNTNSNVNNSNNYNSNQQASQQQQTTQTKIQQKQSSININSNNQSQPNQPQSQNLSQQSQQSPNQLNQQQQLNQNQQQSQKPNNNNNNNQQQSLSQDRVASQLSESPSKQQSQSAIIAKQSSLTKCVFQTKSFTIPQLSDFLSRHNIPQQIITQLQHGYFSHRHIALNICFLNNQIISFQLTHPTFLNNQRYLVIVLFKVVSQKYLDMSSRLLATSIKYLFYNDPCENIICLKLKRQYEDKGDIEIQKSFIKQIKNIKGKIKNIFIEKSSQNSQINNSVFEQTSYMVMRKQMSCKNDQVYLNNVEFQLQIIGNNRVKLNNKIGKLQLSQSTKQMITNGFINKQLSQSLKLFHYKQSLTQYLADQQIQTLQQEVNLRNINQNDKDICLYQKLWLNFSPQIKFTSYAGVYYFLLEENRSCYWEKNNVGFFITKCHTKDNASSLLNKNDKQKPIIEYYFIFMDFVFESDNLVNSLDLIKNNIQMKPYQQVLKTQKQFQNKVVTLPCFQTKQFIDNYNKDGYMMNLKMGLNWKNYLKGVRSIPQEEILSEFIAPFYMGILMKDQQGMMRFVCGGHVGKDDENVDQ